MIVIIARIELQPEKTNEAMPLFEKLVQASRREPGCIQYDLHRDPEMPGLFYFYERWQSAGILDTHNRSAHLQAFRDTIGPMLLNEVEVSRLQLIMPV